MANLRKRRFAHFGVLVLFILLLVGLAGVFTLYSATQGGAEGKISLPQKQTIWWGLGLTGMIFLVWLDNRHLEHYAYVIYFVSVLLLVYVLVFGRSIAGAKRWIELGPIQFQPSELMKLTMMLALAKFFHHHPRYGNYTLRQIIPPFLLFLVPPFILVLLEPDLGTAIILLLLFLCTILFLGLKRESFLALVLIGLANLPIGWSVLKDYQKERILTFLNPSYDRLGSGYNIIQSKIAIGSGGFLGKGLMESTQTRLHFLPEHHTDFIFSAFAEEWGLLGGTMLLLCYLLVLLCALNIANSAKDRFGMIVALGFTFLLFWHVFINIGMCLGLLPVVGVPLPLFQLWRFIHAYRIFRGRPAVECIRSPFYILGVVIR